MKPHFFELWLLSGREVELGSVRGFDHMFFILQLGVHEHNDLANRYPGHCALELPKGSSSNCLEPGLMTALRSET